MTPRQKLALKYTETSAEQLSRAEESAVKIVVAHNGDLRAAFRQVCDMTGNVSLAARASMAPVADFIDYCLED